MSKKYLSLAEEYKEYDQMWEWVDSKGNKITTSGSSNPTTNKTTLPSNIEPYFKKLIAYFQKYLTTDVICCDPRALSLEFPKTGNQLKLRILQMPTNNCVFCTLFDGSNNNEILGHSPQFQTWDQVLDWLIGQGLVRAADRKLCEYMDAKGTKITSSGHSSGWSLYSINSPEVCDGCGQIVEFNPNLKNTQMFFEPFQLKNGHKLCSDCMEVWISLPKGFVDKMSIVSQYEILAGDIDEFVENLKLTQQDIDSMIQEWNNKKKQGLITLQPQEIGNIETHFVDAVQKLGLKATKADFV